MVKLTADIKEEKSVDNYAPHGDVNKVNKTSHDCEEDGQDQKRQQW